MTARIIGWVQAAGIAAFGWPAAAFGAVTFQLDFPDVTAHTGHYWDDPTYGAAARAEIQTRLNEFGAAFAANETVALTIGSTVTVSFYASSGAATFQRQPSGFYDGSAYVKINTGVDLNGGAADGSITFNFNFGHSAPANFPDFIANIQGLTRHELIHVLGMDSFIGSPQLARYDRFLFDAANAPIANPDGTLNPAAQLGGSGIYFQTSVGSHFPIASPGDFSHLIGVMYPYKYAFDEADRAWFRTMGYVLAGEAAVRLTAVRPTLTLRVGRSVRRRLVTAAVTGAIDGPVSYRLRGRLPAGLRFRTGGGRVVGLPTNVRTAHLRVTADYAVGGVPKRTEAVSITLRTRL